MTSTYDKDLEELHEVERMFAAHMARPLVFGRSGKTAQAELHARLVALLQAMHGIFAAIEHSASGGLDAAQLTRMIEGVALAPWRLRRARIIRRVGS